MAEETRSSLGDFLGRLREIEEQVEQISASVSPSRLQTNIVVEEQEIAPISFEDQEPDTENYEGEEESEEPIQQTHEQLIQEAEAQIAEVEREASDFPTESLLEEPPLQEIIDEPLPLIQTESPVIASENATPISHNTSSPHIARSPHEKLEQRYLEQSLALSEYNGEQLAQETLSNSLIYSGEGAQPNLYSALFDDEDDPNDKTYLPEEEEDEEDLYSMSETDTTSFTAATDQSSHEPISMVLTPATNKIQHTPNSDYRLRAPDMDIRSASSTRTLSPAQRYNVYRLQEPAKSAPLPLSPQRRMHSSPPAKSPHVPRSTEKATETTLNGVTHSNEAFMSAIIESVTRTIQSEFSKYPATSVASYPFGTSGDNIPNSQPQYDKLKAENDLLLKQIKDIEEKNSSELETSRQVIQQLQQQIAEAQKRTEEKEKEIAKLKQSSSLPAAFFGLLGQLRSQHSSLKQAAENNLSNTKKEIARVLSSSEKVFKRCREEIDYIKNLYTNEVKLRVTYFNQLQELKGNIRVFCRVRPLLSKENSKMAPSFPSEKSIAVKYSEGSTSSNAEKLSVFEFDRVFPPTSSQEQVFAEAAPIAVSVLDGFNACILAYGQTNSGKTFTMEGTITERGLNYRILTELFRIKEERSKDCVYRFKVSVIEIYNENIYDLLLSNDVKKVREKKLDIRQVPSIGVVVPDVTEKTVQTVTEIYDLLSQARANRQVDSNNVNERSSRSHSVLCVTVNGANLINQQRTCSKLYLVDLAGSEKSATSNNITETKHINRSLSALGDVFTSLQKSSSHIPYRNSKLTYLLQDALGFGSKNLLIVTINPIAECVQETYRSLTFAQTVRKISLGAAKKNIEKPASAQQPTTPQQTTPPATTSQQPSLIPRLSLQARTSLGGTVKKVERPSQ